MSKELLVLLSNRVIGKVTQDSRGKLAFAYDEAWRDCGRLDKHRRSASIDRFHNASHRAKAAIG